MASQRRRSFATCILLACCSCQPCLGFLGSLTSSVAVGKAHKQHFRKHERLAVSTSAFRRSHSHGSSGATTRHRASSGGLLGMVAAPADLWHWYLGALETAPLLTKVGRPLTWIPSYRFFFERTWYVLLRNDGRAFAIWAVFEFQHEMTTTPQSPGQSRGRARTLGKPPLLRLRLALEPPLLASE